MIDEIHRFNRAQQDALLPDVEEGVVILVGLTTANPFFAVNDALVSRSRVFEFEPLSVDDIKTLVRRALTDKVAWPRTIRRHDRRRRAHVPCRSLRRRRPPRLGRTRSRRPFEPTSPNRLRLSRDLIADAVQRKAIRYDPTGDDHYDAASALIKSIRGSDPDAGIYWLARMLEGGEDVRFLARRLVILASEDVGNADPHALPLADRRHAGLRVRRPARMPAHARPSRHLSCLRSEIERRDRRDRRSATRYPRGPPAARAASSPRFALLRCEALGHGKGYEYAHDAPGGVAAQDYLGVEREYYRPTDRGFEQQLGERLKGDSPTPSLRENRRS